MVSWCVDVPMVTAEHVEGFMFALILVAGLIFAFVVNIPYLLERSGFWDDEEPPEGDGEEGLDGS